MRHSGIRRPIGLIYINICVYIKFAEILAISILQNHGETDKTRAHSDQCCHFLRRTQKTGKKKNHKNINI